MPKYTSLLAAGLSPTDPVSFIQAQPEIPPNTPIAVVMDGTKIRSVEIEGITQLAFDSVMAKVQLQFPTAF